METSRIGRDFIKNYEKLRLTAYDDGTGVITIGYGHTATARRGMTITKAQAENLFSSDLAPKENCVNRAVRVSLSQGQFDALVSLAFNIGCGAFQGSTLLRLLNEGNYKQAAEEFPKWNKGGGKVLGGLTKRRAAEVKMFNGGTALPVIAGGGTLQWVLLGSVAVGTALVILKHKNYLPNRVAGYIP